MAVSQRTARTAGLIHVGHGVQFTSWMFIEKVRSSGLMPSFGFVGDTLENAMTESFWSSIRNERLDRKSWTTRVEMSRAMLDFIKVLDSLRRWHSQVG